jgi:hypothetical protein
VARPTDHSKQATRQPEADARTYNDVDSMDDLQPAGTQKTFGLDARNRCKRVEMTDVS